MEEVVRSHQAWLMDLGFDISVTEGVESYEHLEGRFNNKLIMVGRVLTERSHNFEALRSALFRFMNPGKEMEVRRIEDNKFILIFTHPVDFKRVLVGGPWIFDKKLIVLNTVGDDQRLAKVELNWCEFTLYVHGLPYEQRTKEMARYIGNVIGRFNEAEWEDSAPSFGSTLKIRLRHQSGQLDIFPTSSRSPRENIAFPTIVRQNPDSRKEDQRTLRGLNIFRNFGNQPVKEGSQNQELTGQKRNLFHSYARKS
ncbi:hypothetical protein Sango_2963200 [Sesamum angolense]|uniref:DUF4283 domain-containing protein n=1 Tax=Sesamum angolense TaxID=2727404 RepID=A0AAE1T3Y8_9LAMI|nr:hypothetical protein Sango_2963200 [Sesamum angolense]